MLTTTMTFEKMRAQCYEDLVQISTRSQYQVNAWRRKALKRKVFPWTFLLTGTSSNNNDYYLRVSLNKRGDVKNANGFHCCYFVKLVTDDGTAYVDDTNYFCGSQAVSNGKLITSPMSVFMPHLFNRYEERFGLIPQYKNIHEQFISRYNYCAMSACKMQGLHGETYDALGIIQDGLIFGTATDFRKVVWRTFLRTDQLSNKQMEYVQRFAECHNLLENVYEATSGDKLLFAK